MYWRLLLSFFILITSETTAFIFTKTLKRILPGIWIKIPIFQTHPKFINHYHTTYSNQSWYHSHDNNLHCMSLFICSQTSVQELLLKMRIWNIILLTANLNAILQFRLLLTLILYRFLLRVVILAGFYFHRLLGFSTDSQLALQKLHFYLLNLTWSYEFA